MMRRGKVIVIQSAGLEELTVKARENKKRIFDIRKIPKIHPRELQYIMESSDKKQKRLWELHPMTLLETNLDDITAEHLAHCVQLLLDQGAADAWVTPIVMKKGRAAHTLHCLCKETYTADFLEIMFRHTTSLGVRISDIQRAALERKMFTASYDGREISVKVGYIGSEVVSVKAEYDHCRAASAETGVPVQDIARHCELEVRTKLNEND